MTSSLQACPPGFDCAFANSCPSPYLECPPGFFCSSYAGFEGQKEMDYSYAIFKTQFGGIDDNVQITIDNAKKFADPDRAIQNACLTGFYCPEPTVMEPCPSGHWCPERTVEPQKCDDLSICGEQAKFQVNFVNPLIMALLVLIALSCSVYLTNSQFRRNTESNKRDPGARVASPINESDNASDDAQSNNSKPQTKHNKVEMDDKDGLFDVSFEDIHCFIPDAYQRSILPNISGSIPAGKITALMGPTASGKSTLAKFLRHGSLPNCTSGTVTYSIRSTVAASSDAEIQYLTAQQAQPFIGYVPQEDILDRNLTVRELLTFHARAKTRTPRTEAEISLIVDEVLADLAIQHVADAIIGGGENAAANISGGQLKRVNIACELVALSKPALLLLDEPTAGLDAAIAFELMQTLESLKKRGITIFMIIQQPRAEIFERFDHLLLMNSIGGIVYEGASANAVPYLLQLGYTPNEEAFDADYCLDVLNGLRDPTSNSSRKLSDKVDSSNRVNATTTAATTTTTGASHVSTSASTLDCTKLHLIWKEQQQQQQQQQFVITGASFDIENPSRIPPHPTTSNNTTTTNNKKSETSSPTKASSKTKPHSHDANNHFSWSSLLHAWTSQEAWSRFWYHSYLNAERLVIIRLRQRSSFLVYVAVDVIMALALSVGFTIYLSDSYRAVFLGPLDKILQAYYPSALKFRATSNVASLGFSQLMFFMSSALGSAAALAAVPVFSGQAVLAKREHTSGISVIAFAVGRMIGDCFFVAVHGFVFAGVWTLFGHAGHFYDWTAVILSTAFAASGLGYISSATYKTSTASTWAVVAAFLSSVFAGVEPSLAQVSKYPVISWPWYVNFATWTAEATYYTWSKYLTDNGKVPVPLQEGADVYGYEIEGDNGIARSVGAMIGLGIAMRVIAMWLMYRRVTSTSPLK